MKPTARLFAYLAVLGLGVLLMISIHEIGHTVFARLFGDQGATYLLIGNRPEGGACFGCNFYDPQKLSPFGNLVVSVGGVIFTQGTALAILFRRRKRTLQAVAGTVIDLLFAIFLVDLPFQVLQGILANVAAQTGLTMVDLADFLYQIKIQTGLSSTLLKTVLAAVTAVYLAGAIYLYRHRTAETQAAS